MSYKGEPSCPQLRAGMGADRKWAPGPSGKRSDLHCGDGCQASAFTEITGGHTTTGKPMARKFHINKATKPPQNHHSGGRHLGPYQGFPTPALAASRAQPCAVCGVFSSVPPDASTGAPRLPGCDRNVSSRHCQISRGGKIAPS